MGYTVDLEEDDLHCRSEAAAHRAAEIIRSDEWMRGHLEVEPTCRSNPAREDDWYLGVESYDGCHWNEEAARRIWLALSPQMMDEATIEFRCEDGNRFRIRWSQGRVFEEYPTNITWGSSHELAPAQPEGVTPCL